MATGRQYRKFTGAKQDCVPCQLRQQCLRTLDKMPVQYTEAMKQRIDSLAGRMLYRRRIATVEPVLGNLRYNKRLDRFILRGQRKVDTQWKLYRPVDNIEKLAHRGYANQESNKERHRLANSRQILETTGNLIL